MTRSNLALRDGAVAGDRAAFAALVARTAADVDAALPPSCDRDVALQVIYTRAMRELATNDTPPADVDAWLRELADAYQPRRRGTGTTPSLPMDTRIDVLWRRLEPLWPQGKRRRLNRKTRSIIALGVALTAAGAFATWLVLQGPSIQNGTLIATVYQPASADQPAIDPPPNAHDVTMIPVIPLPPVTADDPRPQQPDTPPPAPETPADEPSEAPDDDTDGVPDETQPDPDAEPSPPEDPDEGADTASVSR